MHARCQHGKVYTSHRILLQRNVIIPAKTQPMTLDCRRSRKLLRPIRSLFEKTNNREGYPTYWSSPLFRRRRRSKQNGRMIHPASLHHSHQLFASGLTQKVLQKSLVSLRGRGSCITWFQELNKWTGISTNPSRFS